MSTFLKRQKTRNIMMIILAIVFPLVLNYMSPYLVFMGAVENVFTGSMLLFALQFISSLFFGRAFCGWVCPGGALQEQCARIRKKNVRTGWVDWLKFVLVWGPWITFLTITVVKSGGFQSFNPLFMTTRGLSIGNLMDLIRVSMIIGIIAVFNLIVGKRAFCHYGCWMAPFMMAGTAVRNLLKLPGLRLRADKGKCVQCRKCDGVCPMSLPVSSMVEKERVFNRECILCGRCADTCPSSVLRFSWKRPSS